MQKCTRARSFATYCLLGLLEMPLYFKYDGAAAVFLIGCRLEAEIKEFPFFEPALFVDIKWKNSTSKSICMCMYHILQSCEQYTFLVSSTPCLCRENLMLLYTYFWPKRVQN